uniref:Uncharacterized protein n=1 Tax=Avena sativa TaxID=4498 RepID=A0ACD5ZPG0_AVESA
MMKRRMGSVEATTRPATRPMFRSQMMEMMVWAGIWFSFFLLFNGMRCDRFSYEIISFCLCILGMQGGQVQLRRDPNRANGGGQPQSRAFTYQSSSVTYGGINGAYYTASKTRRSGSDGITVEESKEADTTTKEATHRISRGIHDKGHSLTKKLKADGKVDSTQILHNLNEDELPGFEESWKGNAGQHLPGWTQSAGISNGENSGNQVYGARQPAQSWELPGTQQLQDPRRRDNGRPKSSRIIPIS